MARLLKAYHLSSGKAAQANEEGLYLASSPGFIFNHCVDQHCYLHQVSYQPAAIHKHHEHGHHDVVSSFSFDEHILLGSLTIEQSWSLKNLGDIQALLDGDFYHDMRCNLISSEDRFVTALFNHADEEAIAWLINKLELDYFQACHYLPRHKLHLAKYCQLPEFIMTKDQFKLPQADDFLDTLDTINPDPFAQIVAKQQLATHSFSLDWYSIASDRDYVWQRIGVDYGDVPPPERDALFAIFSAENLPEQASTRTHMVCHALLRQQPWQCYLKTGDKLEVPGGFLVVMLRRGHTELLQELLSYPYLSIDVDLDYFISRLVIYGHDDLLGSLAKQQNHSQAFNFLAESLKQACRTEVNSKDVVSIFSSKPEILEWQLGHELILEEYAREGFKLAVDFLLQHHKPSQMHLNQALLKAAEFGYFEIVKSLHQAGGDLSVGGCWPIKYANKYQYLELKQYLLEHGQEDKQFA